MTAVASARGSACFVRACELDVAVRKPGNVSRASPGHGMHADLFVDSARAAAGALFAPDRRVGDRIEAAVEASWAAAGCNTNLGILLLGAPLARAAEACVDEGSVPCLRSALAAVLRDLDLGDARAAFRAIARANPGGLGGARAEDVRDEPTVGLRDAMVLAADRDSIARQYRDDFAELFEIGLPVLGPGFPLMSSLQDGQPTAAAVAAVQRLYLNLLAQTPDSHIVRKHGEAVAHTVMTAAQGWRERADGGEDLDSEPAFAGWDEALKAARINPGTTADLTVATLLIAGLTISA